MKTIAFVILAACMVLPAAAQQPEGAAKPAAAVKPAVSSGRMTLYLEPMDGQGWQWFFLADTVRRRLAASELKIYPLVSKGQDGSFSARRGEAELAEAVRVAVLSREYPGKLINYLNARALSPSAEGWRDAAVFAGINPAELEKRSAAAGQKALADAYKTSAAAGVSETTLLLDGKPYKGAQRLMPLFTAVNSALPASSRAALPGYTRPVPPGFWVVLSSGAAKNEALVSAFDNYFDGVKPVILDYSDAERASRFPDIAFVPSYVLAGTPEVKSRLDREIKAGMFKESGSYLVYEDRQGRGLYASRPVKKNTVELFVMSHCPFGVLAENAVFGAETSALLPAGVALEVHYIGEAGGKKGAWELSSMHGPAEWEEDARQIFIERRFPDKFKAYLLERNKDVNSDDWQAAAKSAGIDADAVAAGSEEAKDMLAEDFAASNALGISTSPSFVVDGRQFMVGLGELAGTPGFKKIPLPGQTGAGCAK